MNIFDKIPQEVKDLYSMKLSDDQEAILVFFNGNIISIPLDANYEEGEHSIQFRGYGKYWIHIMKGHVNLNINVF